MTIAEANDPLFRGLQELIRKNGFKQRHIATKAGYTAQELNDMLNGRRLIKACDIPKLACALGVTSDDIYTAGTRAERNKEQQEVSE